MASNAAFGKRSGTGKTHIALALGLAACQRGPRVRFTTAAALVSELIEARDPPHPASRSHTRGWGAGPLPLRSRPLLPSKSFKQRLTPLAHFYSATLAYFYSGLGRSREGFRRGVEDRTPEVSKELLKLPAYRELAASRGDGDCGAAMLAQRSVAVPFVSAFVGALAITQAVRIASTIGQLRSRC